MVYHGTGELAHHISFHRRRCRNCQLRRLSLAVTVTWFTTNAGASCKRSSLNSTRKWLSP